MVCGQGGLSVLFIGGIIFGVLGLQGQSDGYPERNILKIHALKREREQEGLYLK